MATRPLDYRVIGAAMAVHTWLGPGLLESTYARCLALELESRNLRFEQERPIDLTYRTQTITSAYRLDFVVEGQLIVEVKSVAELSPISQAQVLTYLRLTGLPACLRINFNVISLRDGIRRFELRRHRRPLGTGTRRG